MFNILTIIVLIFTLIYLWFRKCFTYWKRAGLDGPTPTVPFGNIWPVLKGESQVLFHLNSFYENYKDSKLIGLYVFNVPIVLLIDTELINKVLSTDYQYFNSHHLTLNAEKDPLNYHLIAASGDDWKLMRSKVNPAFSIGKIKNIFQYMGKTSDNLMKFLNNERMKSDIVDIKEALAKYTTDLIVNTTFGFDSNCFENKDSPFRHYGERINDDTFLESIITMLAFLAPSLAESLNIVHAKPDVKKFFTKLVTEAVEYREKNQIKRDDFLGLLIDLKNNTFTEESGKHLNLSKMSRLSEVEIIAQVYLMFFGGFETTSTATSFGLFLLAKYPETQKKAREEVKRVLQKYNGEYSFEAVNEMTYLSNVFYESMRLFPPVPILFRKCLMDYKVPETDVIIKKGTMVFVPAYAIQHDPQYFEDPHIFDPERFSPERKPDNLKKIYFAYGQGPRTCIGIRLGQIEATLATAKILMEYEIELPESMMGPIKFDSKKVTLMRKGGIHIKVKPLSI